MAEVAWSSAASEAALLARAAAVAAAADPDAPAPTVTPYEAACGLLEDQARWRSRSLCLRTPTGPQGANPSTERRTSSPQTSQELKAAVAGSSAADDFSAVCGLMQLAPHPDVLRALTNGAASWDVESAASKEGAGPDRTCVSVRGWQCDLATLGALLVVLSKHAAMKSLRFWRCGLSTQHVELLLQHEGLASLAIEADEAATGCATAALKGKQLQALSLRCAALPLPEVSSLTAELSLHPSLTALSLWSTRLGDAGAAVLLEGLRDNEKLVSLNLGCNLLTDKTAEAVLAVLDEPPPPPAEGEEEAAAAAEGEEAEEAEGGAAAPPPIKPNRTLTALNLSRNRIGTAGRVLLEKGQALSPGLVRLELKGNPCLSCGPGASLSPAERASVASSWEAVGATEGGRDGFVTALLLAFFEAAPAALPLVAFGADAPLAESEGLGEAAAAVGGWIDIMMGSLNAPETLRLELLEVGLKAASRGLPCGAPFETMGSALLATLQETLGEEAFTEAASGAWSEVSAQAFLCMQEAYTPAQKAEAAAAAEAEAAAAAEGEGEGGADAQE